MVRFQTFLPPPPPTPHHSNLGTLFFWEGVEETPQFFLMSESLSFHFLSVYFFDPIFCHGKPLRGLVLMGYMTMWNRLAPTILVFEYPDPPSRRNWIFSALQIVLAEEPTYLSPPPSPTPARKRLRQEKQPNS